ncbi:hypothetical protein [Microbacterium sp. 22242]|uniref:hypothetical protein n=1 Tax=Microbacterium sp. 22242 TaxID=3453896 RepID=UPI003F866CE0
MLWSIGTMGPDRTDAVTDLVTVIADAPDAPVEGVWSVGDDFTYAVALQHVADALLEGGRPATPMSLAVRMAGRGGTVHQVMDDGTLRGWRRDYPDLTAPTLS